MPEGVFILEVIEPEDIAGDDVEVDEIKASGKSQEMKMAVAHQCHDKR